MSSAKRHGNQCCQCADGAAAKKRGGLCFDCWQATQPPTVDGDTIRLRRDALGLTVEDAAHAIGLPDAKTFIDDVEDTLQLDAEYAAEIVCALEALAGDRESEAPAPERSKAPAGARAAESL